MRQGKYIDILNTVIKSCYVRANFILRTSMEFYRGKEFKPLEIELHAIIEREEKEYSSKKNPHFFSWLTIFKSPEFVRPFKCVVLLSHPTYNSLSNKIYIYK